MTAKVTASTGNPTSGWTVRFSVTGANPQTGSATSDGSGNAPFCYTGENGGSDTISAFADTDGNGTQDAPGEPGDPGVTREWLAQPPDTITLTPNHTFLPTNSLATPTAKVTDGGVPLERVRVVFTVTGPNGPQLVSDLTDANGDASFTLQGSFAGDDTVTAFADTNLDSTQGGGSRATAGR